MAGDPHEHFGRDFRRNFELNFSCGPLTIFCCCRQQWVKWQYFAVVFHSSTRRMTPHNGLTRLITQDPQNFSKFTDKIHHTLLHVLQKNLLMTALFDIERVVENGRKKEKTKNMRFFSSSVLRTQRPRFFLNSIIKSFAFSSTNDKKIRLFWHRWRGWGGELEWRTKKQRKRFFSSPSFFFSRLSTHNDPEFF